MAEEMPIVKRSFYSVIVKRLLDIIISGLAILILSPLFLILVVLELVFHGTPVLYSQERPGLHGKLFHIYKFRSMTNEKDENGKLLPSEERLTSFGRFIRRFSLDELPELFCIFTGKMSIIGPRPLAVIYLPYYTKRHMMRHEVRPGFACVPLKPMKTWSWNDQFENDIWYIENCSFAVDVKMIFAVAKEAVVGSEYRVGATREDFVGTNLYADAKAGKEK
jgi:undecaprenyl phosphate N,N'-diacetylbacillosamine 1-phosphate transferase